MPRRLLAVTITRTSNVNKQMMLTANGAFDTRINSGGIYDGLNLKSIADMVDQPQSREKSEASFIIPSTYREHDGRSHDAQRENGEYHMLAIDVDEGSPALNTLQAAVSKVTGDAASLIYSSSGATEANKKWRVLIPLAEPVGGGEYADMQLAMFDMMRIEGIICDPALARTGQPIYLPNVPASKRGDDGEPLFYESVKHRGSGYMQIDGSLVEANANFRRKNQEIAERRAALERERRQADRDAKRSADDVDPVQEFNDRHTIADLFDRYGYAQHGNSQSYSSPMQTSGSHATKDFGTHWVSLSGSDAAAGIGQSKNGDITMAWGDAFDLYCYFEHQGDMTSAVRAYAAELRPSPFEEVNQQIPEPDTDDVDDFDYIPDPEVKIEPQEPSKQEWPTPVSMFVESELPKRQWIYGNQYIRGFVTVTASAGGVGKTSQSIVEALAIVTGRQLLDEPIKERCSVWLINLEDDLGEMRLRLAAAMKHYNISHADISEGKHRLYMDAEDTIAITLAIETREGVVQNDQLLHHMRDKVIERNVGLVIADPFVSTHMVNENSNPHVQAVVAMMRKLARQANVGFDLVHHLRKGSGNEDATIDSVRGAGALIGAARAARVINKVSKEDAMELGVPEHQALGIFRVDDGKNNLTRPAENAVYRRMASVQLDNGENIGVVTPFTLPDTWDGMTTTVVNELLTLIDKGIEGERYSIRPQDKNRWVGTVITGFMFDKAEHTKTSAMAANIIQEWMETDLLEEVTYKSEGQRKERKGVQSTGRVGEIR
jgi:hypothetical protein